MTHLLLFTIGPVQSFIASARKTQDLFAGSAILSHLVAAAYKKLEAKAGSFNGIPNVEIVFPKLDTNTATKKATNPNRFAATVKNLSADELKQLVEEIKQKVIEEDFCNKAWDEIQRGLTKDIEAIAKKQLAALPEIYWTAIEVGEEDYAEKYKRLESYLGGIKNIRNLKQLEEAGRKCNVDGVHNVIVYRKGEGEKPAVRKDGLLNKLFVPESDVVLLDYNDASFARIWEISPGEGLSAVSFYKRRYLSNPHDFPSTARIALMHLLERSDVQDAQRFPDFHKFNALVGSNGNLFEHTDDQLFYEENINETVLRKQGKLKGNNSPENALIELRTAWQNMAKEFAENNLETFTTKYYALLMFDGDKMGEWLSGARLKGEKELLAYHQKLSSLLHDFSAKARTILVEPHGKTVYAAGEDFLGFVNLNSLMDVLKSLRREFDITVNEALHKEKKFAFLNDDPLTFSAGIAIAHYKQPLSTVLEEARSAEKEAKKKGGNNCCLSIMRHSGGTTKCFLPFGTNKEPVALKELDALQIVIREIKTDNFSNTFIHQLMREMRLWKSPQSAGMFQTEAKRLIERSRNPAKTGKDTTATFVSQFNTLVEAGGDAMDKDRLKNAFATLRIADFIQRNLKGETA